jgi:hypothetical protein
MIIAALFAVSPGELDWKWVLVPRVEGDQPVQAHRDFARPHPCFGPAPWKL